MKHTLVYLQWCDAMVNNEVWLTYDEAIEWGKTDNWVINQVGWIIDETDEYILFTSKVSEECGDTVEMVGNVFKIPTTWVLKRIELNI